nr:MAG: capsid protein [Cressdnaviricota sp.]
MSHVAKRSRTASGWVRAAGNLAYKHRHTIRKAANWTVGAVNSKRSNAGTAGKASKDPSSDALTTYHDIQRAYIKPKRKHGGRKLKTFKKFKAKVEKSLRSSQPKITLNEKCTTPIVAPNWAASWATTPSQVLLGDGVVTGYGVTTSAALTLWGCEINDSGTQELHDIASYITNTAARMQTRFNASDVAPPNRETIDIYVRYSKIEFAWVNTTTSAYNIDLYECVAARDIPGNDVEGSPLDCALQNITDTTLTTPGWSGRISMNDYGATPWDCPLFGRSWTIKNKTTLMVPGNGTVNMECLGPKGLWKGIKTNKLVAQKGKTTKFFFVVGSKSAPGQLITTSPGYLAWNKTYHLQFPAGTPTLTDGIEQAVQNTY